MKILNILFCILSIIAIHSCSPKPTAPDGEFVIKGKLSNVPDGMILSINIAVSENGLRKTIAIDTVIGGEFMFRDTITSTVRQINLMAKDEAGYPNIDIWIAPKTLTSIEGDDKSLKTWTITNDVAEQKEASAFSRITHNEQIEYMKLNAESNELYDLYANPKRDKAGDKALDRKSVV